MIFKSKASVLFCFFFSVVSLFNGCSVATATSSFEVCDDVDEIFGDELNWQHDEHQIGLDPAIDGYSLSSNSLSDDCPPYDVSEEKTRETITAKELGCELQLFEQILTRKIKSDSGEGLRLESAYITFNDTRYNQTARPSETLSGGYEIHFAHPRYTISKSLLPFFKISELQAADAKRFMNTISNITSRATRSLAVLPDLADKRVRRYISVDFSYAVNSRSRKSENHFITNMEPAHWLEKDAFVSSFFF